MLLLHTIKVVCQAAPERENEFDWLGMLPTVVAFLAFFFSLRTATQGKRIEISTKRFERLGIQPVESTFATLDQLFAARGTEAATHSLQALTEKVSDVNVVLSHITVLYPAFEYAEVVEAGERFTDQVYAGPHQPLSVYNANYVLWKMLVIDGLYKALDRVVTRWFF